MEDSFSMAQAGDGFRMIRVHEVCCALYFSCSYISSTADYQALECGGWRPCSTWLITDNYESGFPVLEHFKPVWFIRLKFG